MEEKILYYISAQPEAIIELRQHLEMNGYDVNLSWIERGLFEAYDEDRAYIDTILDDRHISYCYVSKEID